MADYQNSGILFRNDDKKNDRAPDYSGKLDVEGHEYRLAGWIKQGKKGKFLSLKISEPQQPNTVQSGATQRAEYDDSPLDDKIPF